MKNLIKNQRGFTLVETILTIVLLSVGLTGGMLLFQTTTTTQVQNDMRVIASKLASEKIESIISDKRFNGYNTITTNNYPEEELAAPYQGFTRTTTVTEVQESDFTTPAAGSGYKRVNVQVRWGNEANQSLTISTVLSSYT